MPQNLTGSSHWYRFNILNNLVTVPSSLCQSSYYKIMTPLMYQNITTNGSNDLIDLGNSVKNTIFMFSGMG